MFFYLLFTGPESSIYFSFTVYSQFSSLSVFG